MELVEQRRDVALVMAEHGLSERQACKLHFEIAHSTSERTTLSSRLVARGK